MFKLNARIFSVSYAPFDSNANANAKKEFGNAFLKISYICNQGVITYPSKCIVNISGQGSTTVYGLGVFT